ncbi:MULTISPECIES: hypothetical protein [unclassified Rathayibacter]|uniref:hypothetical protein n=1 Tax=unclassified Rathayibacter TaxID=2609250 RepID=UPI00188D1D89|nr:MULTISPECIES: hypothetical protein [unclassified Rathayibacter]MBF4461159.1 hypothetical protein [Rathayibacter sp. VKM Ac-2879]MBF4502570.1 hypothetical protein [Rathayibacter sp. VKM Ac-2878]
MSIDIGPTPEQLTRMRSAILSDIAARSRATRKRFGIIGVVLVVALGTSAAAIAVARASVDQANTSFDCYSVADLGADHGTTALVDDDRDGFTLLPLSARVAAARAACERSWSAVPDGAPSGLGPIQVENPTVCLLPDGRLGVLPNAQDVATDSFCESLGASAPAEPSD